MSTYDSTVTLLKELSDEELTAVHDLAFRYHMKKKIPSPFRQMSEEEMLSALAEGRTDAEAGRVINAQDASNILRKKYAL